MLKVQKGTRRFARGIKADGMGIQGYMWYTGVQGYRGIWGIILVGLRGYQCTRVRGY